MCINSHSEVNTSCIYNIWVGQRVSHSSISINYFQIQRKIKSFGLPFEDQLLKKIQSLERCSVNSSYLCYTLLNVPLIFYYYNKNIIYLEYIMKWNILEDRVL